MKNKTLVKVNNRKFGFLDFSFDPKHFHDLDLGKEEITREIIKLIQQNPKLREKLRGKEITTSKFTAVPKRELNLKTKKA
ncbi:MAG: hypothetical protein MUP45_04960 [Candidatus Marinimicrobia bacterium]|nr:hypothetical protein [Candidatus Neomarinimicrobiota bacterium]